MVVSLCILPYKELLELLNTTFRGDPLSLFAYLATLDRWPGRSRVDGIAFPR